MLVGFGLLLLAGGLIATGVFLQRFQDGSFSLLEPGNLLKPGGAAFLLSMGGMFLLMMAHRFACERQTHREKQWMVWVIDHMKPGMKRGDIATYETLCSAVVSAVKSDVVSLGVVRWGLLEYVHGDAEVLQACERTYRAIRKRLSLRPSIPFGGATRPSSERFSVA